MGSEWDGNVNGWGCDGDRHGIGMGTDGAAKGSGMGSEWDRRSHPVIDGAAFFTESSLDRDGNMVFKPSPLAPFTEMMQPFSRSHLWRKKAPPSL